MGSKLKTNHRNAKGLRRRLQRTHCVDCGLPFAAEGDHAEHLGTGGRSDGGHCNACWSRRRATYYLEAKLARGGVKKPIIIRMTKQIDHAACDAERAKIDLPFEAFLATHRSFPRVREFCLWADECTERACSCGRWEARYRVAPEDEDDLKPGLVEMGD